VAQGGGLQNYTIPHQQEVLFSQVVNDFKNWSSNPILCHELPVPVGSQSCLICRGQHYAFECKQWFFKNGMQLPMEHLDLWIANGGRVMDYGKISSKSVMLTLLAMHYQILKASGRMSKTYRSSWMNFHYTEVVEHCEVCQKTLALQDSCCSKACYDISVSTENLGPYVEAQSGKCPRDSPLRALLVLLRPALLIWMNYVLTIRSMFLTWINVSLRVVRIIVVVFLNIVFPI